ncbi:MAG: O-antigen ligase family protein [Crocinitomicaceae bacterium]|nr:O-antigen ligase family protein [Crocinitomicaceae bacterium]
MSWMQQLKEKSFIEISLFLTLLFPFVPSKFASIALIIFTVSSLVTIYKAKNRQFNSRSLFYFILLISIPLLYFFQLVIADEPATVWKIVERKLALIIAPLSFFLINASTISLNPITYVRFFYRVTVVFVAYCSIQLLLQGLNHDYLISGGFAFAFRTTMEEISRLHPTYFGLFIAFSILVGLEELIQRWHLLKGSIKGLMFFSLLFLLLFLLFLAARMALIGLLISLFLVVHKYIRSWKIKGSIFIISIACLISSLFLIPSISSRLKEINASSNNGTSIRTTIWACSVQLIQEAPFLGVGVEQVQSKLNRCYGEKNQYLANLTSDYNTHNEYLNQWANFGIIGLIALLLLLVLFYYRSKESFIFLLFSILVSLSFLTENLLERQMGIFFVAILGSLFVFNLPPTTIKK